MYRIQIAYSLLREFNHRLTGVRRDASPATTLFVTALILTTVQSLLAPVLRPLTRLSAGRPTAAALGAGFATGRYLTSVVGGEPLRDTPGANALIALGFVSPFLEILKLPAELARSAGRGLARAWRYLTVTPAAALRRNG
jgi:hypothetical protein